MKAIIFDLDNCLSAADEVGQELYEPAFEAIRQANRGTLTDEALAAAFSDIWRHPLDYVAREHEFSPEMLSAGWRVFAGLEMSTPMQGYPDLHILRDLPVLRFLVTSGFRRLQESKVRALAFKDLFSGICVDAIDEANRKGKQQIFVEIMESNNLVPREILVVGDNSESEIQAGNNLGMKTVQILRPNVPFGINASNHIHSLAELKSLLSFSIAY